MFFFGNSFDDYDSGHTGRSGVSYGDFAPASEAALRREEKARFEFLKIRNQTAERENLVGKEKVQLLQPDCHLTNYTWGRFSKFVKEHSGWRATRRVATPEEKSASGETRRGKVYFVDVTYTVPQTKKAGNADDLKQTAAKKVKLGDATNATPAGAK